MLRSLLKSAAAYAVSLTGLAALARRSLYRRLPFIVCYHRVVERVDPNDGIALPAMEIGVETLERHLDWLGQHFRIVSVDDLPADLDQRPGSKPLAAITFDDGYSDIYRHAFPLLRRKGIAAGIFVVTEDLGKARNPIAERLYALLFLASQQGRLTADDFANLLSEANVDRSVLEHARRVAPDPFLATQFLLGHLPRTDVDAVIERLRKTVKTETREELHPLSWEMLAEMRDAGITIGSHSKTHAYLTNETEDRILDEAAASRRDLQSRLGIDVRSFAYPGGFFNPAVVSAVATAGYQFAFTICSHRDEKNPMLTIPRTGLWEQSCIDLFGRFSPAIMNCQSAGAFRWMSRCTQAHATA
jgi:peptidoglycan/xylan/chitin deacetylase (PgdA/CDA1 family)